MKKIISALLAVIIIVAPVSMFYTSAETNSYTNSLNSLQDKEEKYQKQLDNANAKIKNKKAYSKTLVKQIEVLNKEISTYHNQISDLNDEIAKKQAIINKAKSKISAQMNALKKRIRQIYMAGDTSNLDIILGAKDFSDFLDKYELVETLSDYDESLIKQVKEQLDSVSDEKVQLVADKKEVESAQNKLKTKQKKLTALLNKNKKVLSKLYSSKSNAEKSMENLIDQEAKIQAQLISYYNATGNTGSVGKVSKSGFVWPVPGVYTITSQFNEDRGYKHKGIDISGGIMGKRVIAAQSGTVISCNNSCKHNFGKSGSCGCGGGYGNFVIIAHAGGKSTLYGHLTTEVVKAGQSVKRGQTIGYAGTTGWSTGPHLHFETRLNGVVYNPLKEY